MTPGVQVVMNAIRTTQLMTRAVVEKGAHDGMLPVPMMSECGNERLAPLLVLGEGLAVVAI